MKLIGAYTNTSGHKPIPIALYHDGDMVREYVIDGDKYRAQNLQDGDPALNFARKHGCRYHGANSGNPITAAWAVRDELESPQSVLAAPEPGMKEYA